MTELLKVLYLGVIEGVTEFIPVSSTGHLILSERLFDLRMAHAESFAVFIQLGAILAVLFLYLPRFLAVFDFRPEAPGLAGVRAMKLYFTACLPAFLFGALLHSFIKTHLFGPITVAWALIVGGVLFFVSEYFVRHSKQRTTVAIENITFRQAFAIGMFQCLALWPGMSRSGSTIIGGMLSGLDRKIAAEFSFIVAVPIMVAAVGYDLMKEGLNLASEEIQFFVIGFVVSFVVALGAIRFFIRLLNHWTLIPFGYYRIVVGTLVLWLS